MTDLMPIDGTEIKTHNCNSINAAKRFIRSLDLMRGESQTLLFESRMERRKALFAMRRQLTDNRDGHQRISVRRRNIGVINHVGA